MEYKASEPDYMEEITQDLEAEDILHNILESSPVCPGCDRIMDIDTIEYNGHDFYCTLCGSRLD